jgi:hypothetical protein
MKRNMPNKIVTSVKAVFFLVSVNIVMSLAAVAVGQNSILEILPGEVFRQQGSETIWQINRSKRLKTQEEVQEYLAALNQGDFHDWRLPTRQELYDLFSIFDLKQSGEVKISLEGSYWLYDEKDGKQVGSWETGDQCGLSRNYFKGKAGHVRAVRP